MVPIELHGELVEINGDFQKVLLICSNVSPEGEKSTIEYDASWGSTSAFITNIQYDNGEVVYDKDFMLDVGLKESDRGMAEITTVFNVPPGSSFHKIGISPYFLNQYPIDGQDINQVRDVTVNFRADDDGLPGEILFSKVIVDNRSHSFIGAHPFLGFLDIHLEQHRADIGEPLPDRIHIGVAEAGADTNRIVVQATPYSGANKSHLLVRDSQDQLAWTPLQSLSLPNDGGSPITFRRTAYPIRATFITDPSSVSNETSEIAVESAVVTNYPNPFSDRTNLFFNLKEGQEVQVRIFDVNGRMVQKIDSGFLASGKHVVELRDLDWANGLYVYELQTSKGVFRGSMLGVGQ